MSLCTGTSGAGSLGALAAGKWSTDAKWSTVASDSHTPSKSFPVQEEGGLLSPVQALQVVECQCLVRTLTDLTLVLLSLPV